MRILTAAFLLVASQLGAQTSSVARVSSGDGFDFTIKNIMRGPELYGRTPANTRWSADGKWIYFQWNEPATDWREPLRPFRVRATAGARPERLTLAQSDSAAPYIADGPISPDGRMRAVDAGGDLYLVSFRDGSARRLTQTVAAETHPTFSVDGKTLYFLRDGNAYALTLDGGDVRQLTDIRTAGAAGAVGGGGAGGGAAGGGGAGGATARADSIKAATQLGRLEQQQKDLFEVIRDRAKADSMTRADRLAREASALAVINIAATERVQSIEVSPNGRAAIVVVGQQPATTPRAAEVPQFVTSTGYVENIRGRTKVGDALNNSRVLWISLPSGKATPLRPFGTDSTSGNTILGAWSDDGSRALMFALPSNHKSRVLYTVRSDTAALTEIETLKDTAWVGGPCSSCAGFLEGGKRVWFASEESGYSQLYTANAAGGDVKSLTSGRWEILAANVSADRQEFYLQTSELSSNDRNFYRMPVAGGARTRITTAIGNHVVTPSPDGKWLADVSSFTNVPPELYLVANTPGAAPVRMTTSPSAEWMKGPWIAPALV
ncbi:MAG: hypothetical protein JWM95_5558 [Gemmatimonadetes bacterium]|nr:hypothetical protein [Gemmatimonadota bacterium]